jgi:hypothetical protein
MPFPPIMTQKFRTLEFSYPMMFLFMIIFVEFWSAHDFKVFRYRTALFIDLFMVWPKNTVICVRQTYTYIPIIWLLVFLYDTFRFLLYNLLELFLILLAISIFLATPQILYGRDLWNLKGIVKFLIVSGYMAFIYIRFGTTIIWIYARYWTLWTCIYIRHWIPTILSSMRNSACYWVNLITVVYRICPSIRSWITSIIVTTPLLLQLFYYGFTSLASSYYFMLYCWLSQLLDSVTGLYPLISSVLQQKIVIRIQYDNDYSPITPLNFNDYNGPPLELVTLSSSFGPRPIIKEWDSSATWHNKPDLCGVILSLTTYFKNNPQPASSFVIPSGLMFSFR